MLNSHFAIGVRILLVVLVSSLSFSLEQDRNLRLRQTASSSTQQDFMRPAVETSMTDNTHRFQQQHQIDEEQSRLVNNGSYWHRVQRRISGNKEMPSKGDSGDNSDVDDLDNCNSNFNNLNHDLDGDYADYAPWCYETTEPGDHEVKFTLYIALEPKHPGLGKYINEVVSDELYKTEPFLTIQNGEVQRPSAYEGAQNQSAHNNMVHLDNTTSASTLDRLSDEPVEMFLRSISVVLVEKNEDRWWWQHNFTFDVYWKGDNSEVENTSVLMRLDAIVEKEIAADAHSGRLYNSLQRKIPDNALVDVTIDWPPPCDGHPCESDATFETIDWPPPSDATFENETVAEVITDLSKNATYLQPLNPKDYWNWQRYVGLGLFLWTIVTVFLLTLTAAVRQRRRVVGQNWGNLVTEEGINELLSTGWVIRSGNQEVLEVFEKKGLGYLEDDSILLGGFEYKSTVITGTSMTQGGSEVSPSGVFPKD